MGFFSDLFGGASGKKAANAGADAAAALNAQGGNMYRQDVNNGYAAGQNRLSGYEQQGRQAYNQYADAIGANGSAGYQNALSNFNADPFRAGQQDAADRAIRSTFRQYNAGGMGNSGTAGVAVGRVGSDIYGQQVADYRNRLMGLGQQGGQYASQMAQNDINQGQATGGSWQQQYGNQANIEQQRQANIYQAQQAGMNNIMKAVGGAANLVMGGFTPGAGGGTAFGNMGNALSRRA